METPFAKIVLKVTVPEATSAFQDDHFCARLKAGIGGTVQGVQAIWDSKSTTEDWGFLLVDAKKTRLTRSIKLECCGKFDIYGHPEIASFLISIVTGHCLFCGTGMGRPYFCTIERAWRKGTQ